MKKLMMIAIAAMFTLSAQATMYTWTDFNRDSDFSLTLWGPYGESGDAYNAALATIADIKAGNLQGSDMHRWQWTYDAKDKCTSMWSKRTRKIVGDYIAKAQSHNARVKISGFKVNGPVFDESGNPKYSARITGTVPCLKKNKYRDDD